MCDSKRLHLVVYVIGAVTTINSTLSYIAKYDYRKCPTTIYSKPIEMGAKVA